MGCRLAVIVAAVACVLVGMQNRALRQRIEALEAENATALRINDYLRRQDEHLEELDVQLGRGHERASANEMELQRRFGNEVSVG